MRNIYLVRHGQDEDNAAGILNGRRDSSLTAKGREQAEAVAAEIASLKLDIKKIYSSPLQRALRTARTISQRLELDEPETLDLLLERDFGIMTGESISNIEKICGPRLLRNDPITYFLDPPGAETFPELVARGKKLLDFLEKANSKDNILLVSHGDIGKMIYAAFYQLDWQDVLRDFHFGNTEILILNHEIAPEKRHLYRAAQFNK